MSREKVLIKNIMIYAVGNFGSKFLNLILLPFYSYYLTPNEYGYFDLIMATLIFTIPIITFQINEGLYRYLLDVTEKNKKIDIISNSLLIILRNLIIANAIYLVFVQFINIQYKYIILIQVDLSIIYSIWTQIARGIRDNIYFSIASVLLTFITLISNMVLIIIFNLGLDALFISNIIALIIAIAYLESTIKVRNYINIKFKNRMLRKELTAYSIPLIPTVVNWWFMNVSDRFMLNFFLGTEATGIYAVANKFPSILVMINSIFYLAWQESAIIEYSSHDKNKFYTKMFNQLMTLALSSVVVLLAFTKMIISVMISSSFNSSWRYIPFLYMSTIFSLFASFYGTGYLSSKETKAAFYTSILGSVLNVILNIVLIPIIGIQAASLSTMLAFLVMWLARLIHTKKYYIISINKSKFFTLIFITTIYTYLYYKNDNSIEFALMGISIIVFVIYNKSFLNTVFQYMKYKFK
jgi:O-antigen/teichoic acid export membrane protein